MINKIFIFISLLSSLLLGCAASAQVCEQLAGDASLENREYEKAFDLLKGCEYSTDVTSETLLNLFVLYRFEELVEMPQYTKASNRFAKGNEILVGAAKTGDEASVELLTSIYETGDAEAGLLPQPEIGERLEALLYSDLIGKPLGDAIEKCLDTSKVEVLNQPAE